MIFENTNPRSTTRTWLWAALAGVLLLALGAHLYLLRGLPDPAEHFWLDTFREDSSYYQWNSDTYRRTLRGCLGVIGFGLLLGLAGRWYRRLRWPARFITVLGAGAAVACRLLQPAFWTLGTGLSPWTYGLPLRLSLMAVALSAIFLYRTPRARWPRWTLAAAFLALVGLQVISQTAQAHLPKALYQYCIAYRARCDTPPPSCRIPIELPESSSTMPARRLLASIPIRAKAQARLADRIALHHNPKGAPRAWRDLAPGHRWTGSSPWKAQDRNLENARAHLRWQHARLILLGLVLLVGLPLTLWLALRPHSGTARLLLLPLALAAVATATGLVPEWSHVSLLKHIPTALIIPLTVALLGWSFAPPRADQSASADEPTTRPAGGSSITPIRLPR